jgi:SWI/SNF-related matrix-associated actin-dependent regulator 1 of chromatin subfamily A
MDILSRLDRQIIFTPHNRALIALRKVLTQTYDERNQGSGFVDVDGCVDFGDRGHVSVDMGDSGIVSVESAFDRQVRQWWSGLTHTEDDVRAARFATTVLHLSPMKCGFVSSLLVPPTFSFSLATAASLSSKRVCRVEQVVASTSSGALGGVGVLGSAVGASGSAVGASGGVGTLSGPTPRARTNTFVPTPVMAMALADAASGWIAMYGRNVPPPLLHTMVNQFPFAEGTERWMLPLRVYDDFCAWIQQEMDQRPLQWTPLPESVVRALSLASDDEGVTVERLVGMGVDEPLATSLAPLQRAGVSFLVNLCRNEEAPFFPLLADEPGLGKTVQTLAALSALGSTHLILCPAIAIPVWVQENRRVGSLFACTVLSSSAHIREWIGCGVHGSVTGGGRRQELVLVSYHLAHALLLQLEEGGRRDRVFDVLVMDESHAIKNGASMQTTAALALARTWTRMQILMSGTPTLSRPSELWTQLEALSFHKRKAILASMTASQFARKYQRGHVVDLHVWLLEHVMKRRYRHMLVNRRIPWSLHMHRLGGEEAEVSESNAVSESNEEGSLPNPSAPAFPANTDMAPPSPANTDMAPPSPSETEQQPLDNRSNKRKTPLSIDQYNEDVVKRIPLVVPAVKSIIDTYAKDQSGIVFVAHYRMIDALLDQLGSDTALSIDGRVPTAVRAQRIHAFQQGQFRIILCSANASQCITLTRASFVVFAELYWTPAAIEQAKARCDRIGQCAHALHAHFLICQSSSDLAMEALLQKKATVQNETWRGACGESMFEQSGSSEGDQKETIIHERVLAELGHLDSRMHRERALTPLLRLTDSRSCDSTGTGQCGSSYQGDPHLYDERARGARSGERDSGSSRV